MWTRTEKQLVVLVIVSFIVVLLLAVLLVVNFFVLREKKVRIYFVEIKGHSGTSPRPLKTQISIPSDMLA